MNKVFARNFLLFVALLTVCVSALVYHFISSDREVGKIDERVIHTHQVITEAEQLSSGVKAMLSSQRGYLLTGDNDFLKDYATKKEKVSNHIGELKQLTFNNASQQKRLDALADYYAQFSMKLENRAKRIDPAADKNILDGVELVDELEENIVKINKAVLAEEYELLNQRVQNLQARKSQYLTTLIVGVIVGSILLLLFNAFLFRAQRKRTVAETSLKDSEDRFTLALEGTQDGIYDWNVPEDKMFYSSRFFSMLGYEDGAKIGTVQDSLKLVHRDDIDELNKTLNQYLEGNLSEFSHEFRLQQKSGNWIWVQSRARALFDKKGKAYRLVGANTDITHLKKEQEKLEAEKQKAEDANIAKSDFLAHMSHEIRTPLTAVSGIAEIFERNQDNLNDKQKKLIQTLNASTSSLKDLINDILDFSKIESGDFELDEKCFPISNLFAEIISMMSVRANEKNINFMFDDSAVKDEDFFGDDHRIKQILVNLIGNALKFTDQGGDVKVQVQFEGRDDLEFLRIIVSDTGIGIDPDEFNIVFERFKQGDSSVSRQYGGTGLGLPISRNLARLMGGDISLSSQKGEGSTFSVLLPMKIARSSKNQGQAVNNKEDNKKLTAKIQSSVSNKTKALLVEDYKGNIVVIGYILDEIGLEYDVAKNGVEATQMWQNTHYDIILMDVQMPEMDGFTATKYIRAIEKEKSLSRTPIIGMTAHALVGDKNKCIEAGMDSYLPKPIVEIQLKKEIFKLLKKFKIAA